MLRASGNQQWTVYVVGATAAQLAAGDSIEMLLIASAEPTGWVSQTLVLTQSEQPGAVRGGHERGAGRRAGPVAPSANLTVINDDGVTCMDTFDVPCARRSASGDIIVSGSTAASSVLA